MMKKTVMTLLLTMLCVSMHAFYPCYDNRFSMYYPDAVMGIAHDDGYIYVARLDGFVVIDKATGGKTVFSKSQGTLDYLPTAVAVEPGGTVWIGTREGVLLKYDGSGMTACDLGLEQDISNIFFDTHGYMYVTAYYGAYRIVNEEVAETLDWPTFKYSVGGYIAFVSQGFDGKIWMAGHALQGGLSRFGTIVYTPEEGVQYPCMDYPDYKWGRVYGLAAAQDGSVWFVHTRDLNQLADGQMTTHFVFPSAVYGMAFDVQQRLWVSGINGPLYMVSGETVDTYDAPFDTSFWSCIDIDGDDVYIGTDSQLLMFRDGTFTTLDVEVTTAITPPLRSTSGRLLPEGRKKAAAQPAPAARFDLQGRRFSGTPTRSGLYIQDGRKVVVR